MFYEIISLLEERIAKEEKWMNAAEKYGNLHAYHQGQIQKMNVARQNIKDCLAAQERFTEMCAGENPEPTDPMPAETEGVEATDATADADPKPEDQEA